MQTRTSLMESFKLNMPKENRTFFESINKLSVEDSMKYKSMLEEIFENANVRDVLESKWHKSIIDNIKANIDINNDKVENRRIANDQSLTNCLNIFNKMLIIPNVQKMIRSAFYAV